jgi:hypothetical protein
MNDLNTKPGLLAHLAESHSLQIIRSSPYAEIYGLHELDHAEGNVTHSHNEEPEPETTTEAPDFQHFVEAEIQRRMMETQKRYEAGWQSIVGHLQNAGAAKAELDAARKAGNDVMNAAVDFRKAEAELSSAIASMIEMIAGEHA